MNVVHNTKTKATEKVRRYRMVLLGILIVLVTIAIWYCVQAAGREQQPQRGTLVYQQMDEGIAEC